MLFIKRNHRYFPPSTNDCADQFELNPFDSHEPSLSILDSSSDNSIITPPNLEINNELREREMNDDKNNNSKLAFTSFERPS